MKQTKPNKRRKWRNLWAAVPVMLAAAALLAFWPQTEPEGTEGDPAILGVEIGRPAGSETENSGGGEGAGDNASGTAGTSGAESNTAGGTENSGAESNTAGGTENSDAETDGEKRLPEGLLEELEQLLNGADEGTDPQGKAPSRNDSGAGGNAPSRNDSNAAGNAADGLVAYMKTFDPAWYREDSAFGEQRQYELVEYFAGDSYETKTVWGSTERTAKFTYNYIWEGSSRFQDQHRGEDPDLVAQRERVRAMLQYLLPEFGEEAYRDFLQVEALNYQDRRWYSRTAWYGERLVQFSIQSGTVTGTVYPYGYTDEINGLPQRGEVEELFGDEGVNGR